MLLSKSCEYGIRAALFLATHDDEGYVPIRTISDELGISFHFLTKIFQRLTEAGILVSLKGPRGGVQLARPADRISIRDLVAALDGEGLFRACVLGLPGCGHERPCPLHDAWTRQRTQIDTLFSQTMLGSMAGDITTLGLRLADRPHSIQPEM